MTTDGEVANAGSPIACSGCGKERPETNYQASRVQSFRSGAQERIQCKPCDFIGSTAKVIANRLKRSGRDLDSRHDVWVAMQAEISVQLGSEDPVEAAIAKIRPALVELGGAVLEAQRKLEAGNGAGTAAEPQDLRRAQIPFDVATVANFRMSGVPKASRPGVVAKVWRELFENHGVKIEGSTKPETILRAVDESLIGPMANTLQSWMARDMSQRMGGGGGTESLPFGRG